MNHEDSNNKVEYIKFVGIMFFITVVSWLHAQWRGFDLMQFLESFMGVFFIVFASFKIYNLKEFAYGFKSYEIMKNRSVNWGFSYPFIQVLFGVMYLAGWGSAYLDMIVFLWSSFGAYVVMLTLRKKADVHCVCLGNVIKLPLSTISFVEDFGMANIPRKVFSCMRGEHAATTSRSSL